MIPDFCEIRPFDSEVLGHPVWALKDPSMAAEAVEAAKERAVGLLFCRGTEDAGTRLEAAGFRFIEDLVSFEAPLPETIPSSHDSRLRLASQEDADALAHLAGVSFHTTRWHLDPAIPDDRARAFKSRWVENSVRGRAIGVLVATDQHGGAIGFNALMAARQSLVIDLIAVHPDHQGQGIGSALVRGAFVFAQRQGFSGIRVGTQSVNRASIALYETCGFREVGRARTWHHTPFDLFSH